jgi:hypothetical protein
MKRFSFRLERVLQFRRQMKELELSRLERLARQRMELTRRAAEYAEQSLLLRSASISRQTAGGLDLRRAHEYAQALRRSGEQALAQAQQVEQQRRKQLKAVIRAGRQVKLLELLRARKLRLHAQLTGREQDALAAELYLAKLAAKKF